MGWGGGLGGWCCSRPQQSLQLLRTLALPPLIDDARRATGGLTDIVISLQCGGCGLLSGPCRMPMCQTDVIVSPVSVCMLMNIRNRSLSVTSHNPLTAGVVAYAAAPGLGGGCGLLSGPWRMPMCQTDVIVSPVSVCMLMNVRNRSLSVTSHNPLPAGVVAFAAAPGLGGGFGLLSGPWRMPMCQTDVIVSPVSVCMLMNIRNRSLSVTSHNPLTAGVVAFAAAPGLGGACGLLSGPWRMPMCQTDVIVSPVSVCMLMNIRNRSLSVTSHNPLTAGVVAFAPAPGLGGGCGLLSGPCRMPICQTDVIVSPVSVCMLMNIRNRSLSVTSHNPLTAGLVAFLSEYFCRSEVPLTFLAFATVSLI
ncbi:hypothetical protein J6590_031082 [Homalodisca vitripennis]|nr:hypothetical protein J6590_031082 [Homalodisca vitripennis]